MKFELEMPIKKCDFVFLSYIDFCEETFMEPCINFLVKAIKIKNIRHFHN